MKITIITTTYNSAQTINDCVKSVNSQTYPEIEHIFIDGNSNDNTLALIRENSKMENLLLCEPDDGLYDAMNKGINNATGEIIGILNSDDLYYSNKVLEKVVDVFKKDPEVQGIHGDLIYVKKNDIKSKVRYWKTGNYSIGAFKKGWHPAHPTLFLRKSIYDKYGAFNLSFKLAADFEFMLRVIEKYRIKTYYLPEPIVKMRLGGTTNKNVKNIVNQNFECFNAFKINNINVSIFYPVLRLLPKLKQFIINQDSHIE